MKVTLWEISIRSTLYNLSIELFWCVSINQFCIICSVFNLEKILSDYGFSFLICVFHFPTVCLFFDFGSSIPLNFCNFLLIHWRIRIREMSFTSHVLIYSVHIVFDSNECWSSVNSSFCYLHNFASDKLCIWIYSSFRYRISSLMSTFDLLYLTRKLLDCWCRKSSSDVCSWANLWSWWQEDETCFSFLSV